MNIKQIENANAKQTQQEFVCTQGTNASNTLQINQQQQACERERENSHIRGDFYEL